MRFQLPNHYFLKELMTDNYQILIQKLDAFIRKYYKNQIIRGVIYSVAALVVFFLTVTLLEYFAWMGTTGRTIIFYMYLFISALIVVRLILIPVFKLFRIGKVISHEQAASIIGKHFTDVQDKLLNTLQLRALSESGERSDLIRASIDQRIKGLRPVPFSNAIDLKGNRKYLKYAIPPVLIILVLIVAAPNVITEPTERIIKHNDYFEKEAPFKFVLENDNLQAIQQDDYQVNLKIVGESVPESVVIYHENTPFRMKKISNVSYTYTFRNLQKDIDFMFEANDFTSDLYKLKVLPRPIILNFESELTYPAYTKKKAEVLDNTGDLVVPEGTEIKWNFNTRDTKNVNMRFSDTLVNLKNAGEDNFSFENHFYKSQPYSITTGNQFLTNSDSLEFALSVIPDVYPSISIEEFTDSVSNDRIYFKGFIKDDWGFTRLGFFFRQNKNSAQGSGGKYQGEYLKIQKDISQQQFFHYLDIASLNLQPGEEVEYYFEVWDNDGVNGIKSTKSQKMIYKAPSVEELEEKAEATNKEVKSEMENALKDLQLLQHDIDDMNKNMFEKKTLNWQDKQQIQDLLNRHQSIQQRLENLQEQNEQKIKEEQQYEQVDEQLLEKQKQLQEMMENLLTDEMKDMIDEIRKMLDELDKDKVNEMMEEMKMSNEDLEEQIDRNLELFKQLEFEQQLQETIDKLKDLAKEQDELSEDTRQDKDGEKSDELKEKQDELNKKFDDIRKDMDELEQKNQDLENPNKMENTDQQEEDIQESMEQSSDQLQQQQNSKASESQQNSSQKMQELSEQMQQMMNSMMQQQMGEDMNTLREILENLIQISFDQEDLMNVYSDVSTSDPKYTSYIEDQQNLQDDMVVIADSLKALAKRQMMIKPFVMKELSNIDKTINETLDDMEKRQVKRATNNQQLAMTSMNNLALLLGESLDQMQQQMMSMQATGQSSCNKPGKPGGSQQMKSMRGLQEQLNKQLQQLRDGKKPGKQGKDGQSMSEQLARMAAQQAAIRRKMEEFQQQLKDEGRLSDGNVSKMIDDMEKTEKDIVNKKITQETLKRQQEILTRLLKSEKAEQQREQEQKRESKEAKNPKISNPDDLFEYYKIRNREVELLKTLPPNLKPFYKNKVTEYFYRFE